ncbi:hypothetical protein [Enterobacter kobei]|uniref:hypothetical protein n=1 Tax=Enterobacter kobei TaxID=208224 RepID=UPI00403EFD1B
MEQNVNFTLSVYQDLFHKTETTLRNCVTSMPQRESGNFTDGYLRGIIFHWWLMANAYGIPAAVIDNEERHLRTLAGLPEEDA